MKKGQTNPAFDWLVEHIMPIMELILVLAIVVGAFLVITRTGLQPEEQDFKRVLDAYANLLDNFESEKIATGASFTVPIASERPFYMGFYPQGDSQMPDKCRGKSCICMEFVPEGTTQSKVTCRVVSIAGTCKTSTCGEELCAGPHTDFIATRGDKVRIEISCMADGQKLTVAKV